MSSHLNFKIERDELSERLGGGLPRGALIVVEGPFGAGKSIFTQRVLYGLLENDHSVGVISTELTTLGFVRQMKSLDYGIDNYLLTGRLLFYPVFPLMGERHTPYDLLARMRRAKRLFDKDVVVVDTLSKLLDDQYRLFRDRGAPAPEAYGEAGLQIAARQNGHGRPGLDPQAALSLEVEETIYLLKRLTAAGKTVILTMEPQDVSENMLSQFRSAADVHLGLDFTLLGNTASRRIVVNRFSRAKGRFGDVIGYRVEPEIGLVIEIKSVA